ncbi:MAG: TetR/AcrR family transcriptional regulator [Gemmatimonadales bacterium]
MDPNSGLRHRRPPLAPAPAASLLYRHAIISIMTPRPQARSDAQLLEGAARVIGRIGITRLTLADVAEELAISPGTLVHRFGSKRGLLMALLRRSVARSPQRRASRAPAGTSPYHRLLAMSEHLSSRVETPEALANNLAFLQVGLADPEIHRLMARQARALQRELETLVLAAIEAGELLPCDARKLARAMRAAMDGTLLQWAIERKGRLAPLIRQNVETLLSGYRPLPAPGAAR